MIWFGDLRFWMIGLGMICALMLASVLFKAITGRDLDPPDDGE